MSIANKNQILGTLKTATEKQIQGSVIHNFMSESDKRREIMAVADSALRESKSKDVIISVIIGK